MIGSGPLASVVIPAWNRPYELERAIRSVLGQTESDLEVVVVDNGSDDPASVEQIVTNMGDRRVRLVRLPTNEGPSAGRNAGASVAQGWLVGFLDSDDEVTPDWLARLSAPFARGSYAFTTCGFVRVDSQGVAGDPVLPGALTPAFDGITACFQAGTMLIDRAVLQRIGGYRTDLWFGENTELGLRLVAHVRERQARTSAIDQALLRWHAGPSGRYDARKRLAAAEVMLHDHAERLAGDRFLLSSYLRVAAVSAARLGEFRGARRYLRRSTRVKPNAADIARLALMYVPPLARRRWPPE